MTSPDKLQDASRIVTNSASSDDMQNLLCDMTSSVKLHSSSNGALTSADKLYGSMTSLDKLSYGSVTPLDKLQGVTCGRRRWTGDLRYMLKMGLHVMRLGARRLSPRHEIDSAVYIERDDATSADVYLVVEKSRGAEINIISHVREKASTGKKFIKQNHGRHTE
ncbi:hypothetical protein BaRGS_00027206, partial [Batillaria attramentaria]